MKLKCYYHEVDLDGKCSAAIVKRKYPDCELIGVDYPDRPDFNNIQDDEIVFVVDFSFDRDDMIRLDDNYKLVWIDHHKSALKKIPESSEEDVGILGKREIGKAGCELTWEYLFPDEMMPEAVRLLGRYDVWDHSDMKVLPFQMGMRLCDCGPEWIGWKALLSPNNITFRDIIKTGHIVYTYEKQQNTTYAEAMAFPVEFEGHKAWAINKALSNSKIFETIENAKDRPLWILFSYKVGLWKYSLYSSPDSGLDVSKIAAKYGGGGHAGAAGFQSDKYLLTETII